MPSRRVFIRIVLYGFAVLLIAVLVACIYRHELIIEWQRVRIGEIRRVTARLTSDLPVVDEVRLLRLDEVTGDAGEPRYTTLYEPAEMRIAASKKLTGSEAADFLAVLRTVRLADGNTTMCHDPHHVVQLYDQGRKVGEMVICFSCENVAIPTWVQWELVNFDPRVTTGYEVFRRRMEAEVGAYIEPVRKRDGEAEAERKE